MKRFDVAELTLLAALWGGSFLFARMAAPEFGAVPMAAVRTGGAALCLLPLMLLQGQAVWLRRKWASLLVMAFFNSALPFALFGFAALTLPSGLMGVFNATTPLWGAVIAWLWLRQRVTGWRVVGLGLGFVGVAGLAVAKSSFAAGDPTGWAVLACLGATAAYGMAASMTKRWLDGVPTMALAAASQLGSALLLAPLAVATWPAQWPSARAWAALLGLAVLCTGFAYVLYFRLIARVGPANALSVTFLIPVFASLWGTLFLQETVTLAMLVGSAVILAGTALATGFVSPGSGKAAAKAA